MEQAAVAQNWFATIALLTWPFVALWLYQTRLVNEATLWTILGAYLLLPVGASVKIAQGIPQIDKTSIAGVSAAVGCWMLAKRPIRFQSGFGLAEALLLVFLFSPLVTSLLNSDTVAGAVLLAPLGAYDGLSAVMGQFLFVLPFLLGRQLLRNSPDVQMILRTLAIAGLLYSVPMLFEIRMSPQLHLWVYGYYPSEFIQQIRDGGFRPVVFIGHGLPVAFFAMSVAVAAGALWRARINIGKLSPAIITTYLSFVLLLCKSLGPLMYGALLGILIRFTRPRTQLRIAAIIVLLALSYPALRSLNLVPTEQLVNTAAMLSEDRAQSLEVRFSNEQQLLSRALQRPFFGWGRWGRSRVYNEYGKDISTTDGRWIITLGQFGLIGFLAEFGLLALPVLRAASALRFMDDRRDRILFSALVLISAINVIDLLPNADLIPWTWLLSGALLGRSEALRKAARRPLPIQSETAAKLAF